VSRWPVPVLRGSVDRRLVLTYRLEPTAAAAAVPDRFRPRTVRGHALGSLLILRIRGLRPRGLPERAGRTTYHALHRVAVEWSERNRQRSGAYVIRRASDSRLSALLGRWLAPGGAHHATFAVDVTDERVEATVSDRSGVRANLAGTPTDELPADSVFDDITRAAAYFEADVVGHSPPDEGYRGVALRMLDWEVTPVTVEAASASFFDDLGDAATVDHAFVTSTLPDLGDSPPTDHTVSIPG
jgi:hypothetical protein